MYDSVGGTSRDGSLTSNVSVKYRVSVTISGVGNR